MKNVFIALSVTLMLLVAVVAFADKSVPSFKKGDAVFACTCGDSCACKTISRKEGKCGCGSALGKGVVSSANSNEITVKVGDKNFHFPAKAKYTCACGDGCKCGTISQKPGKCGCGSEMKKTL